MDQTDHYAIELRGIDKRFGSVHANKLIDLKVRKGSIHGIVGENGAGKSTLMSIIYGFYHADSGEMFIDGQPFNPHGSQDAIAAGIGMVHQHFMLVNNFTVLENVILGAENGWHLNQSVAAAEKLLGELARDYGLEVPLHEKIEDLPVGLQQRVEILKALYRGARILILDEPTGVLTPQEADHLFKVLGMLRDQGATIILITHKLREILAITDQVSIMRRGEMVEHVATKDTNKDQLAELMVGRKVRLKVDKGPSQPGEVKLKVEGLSYFDSNKVERVKSASFEVRAGEIVGIAGVSGNGQSELLSLLGGIIKPSKGSFTINSRSGVYLVSPEQAADPEMVRNFGLGHVPEDRHKMGLINRFAAKEAFILGYQSRPQYNKGWLQNKQAIEQDCQAKMEKWDVRPPHPDHKTANFSGGNQQKLVLAREVEQDPDVLLVGQPTRGVDIGAIEYIHKQIIAMRDHGKAVLLVSVELDEIMTLADRILVMAEGRIVGELDGAKADERTLGLMMANIVPDEVAATQPQGATS
ncbi:ABC transporter ATP-binding protein [Aeromonas sp. MdU4]|uniref:ABC transporter ATP-binding protein n=1 Tax=Aeromonas sp. MdU4 TaxID=3342819 RepID=UPI0035B8902E